MSVRQSQKRKDPKLADAFKAVVVVVVVRKVAQYLRQRRLAICVMQLKSSSTGMARTRLLPRPTSAKTDDWRARWAVIVDPTTTIYLRASRTIIRRTSLRW